MDLREHPFYDGPELQGLSPDARFDLAKQLRIRARNQRLAARHYGKGRKFLGPLFVGVLVVIWILVR